MTRRLQTSFAILLTGVMLISTTLTGGCSNNSATQTGTQTGTPVLQGWVSASGPVTGANLAIYDTKGIQIHKTDKPATGDFGSFLMEVNGLPADFRIAATDGSVDGESLLDELSADYRGFDPETDTVYVNALTTIVSTYLDKHPDKTLEEVTTTVKNYLEIPEWIDIGRGLYSSDEYFSYSSFIEEANDNGGFNDYIDYLVAEMDDSTTGISHSFSVEASSNILSPGTVWVLDGLGKGVLTYTGGNLFGWALSQAGVGFGDEKDAAIRQMLLNLANISKQLDNINDNLAQIELQIAQGGYNTQIGQISDIKSAIMTTKDDLVLLATNPPSKPDLLQSKKQDIIEAIRTAILPYRNVIHDQLTDEAASAIPLLKQWSQVVKKKYRFLSTANYPAIQAQFDYFDTLQVTMLELLVEYYHAQGEGKDYHEGIDAAIKDYEDHIAEQKALLLPAVPEGVYLDTKAKLMIWMPDTFRAMVTPDFSGMTTTVDGGFTQILNMRNNSFLGVNDWRYPSAEETTGFFDGWQGKAYSAWEYAQSQGFAVMNRELFIPNLLETTWEKQWVTMNNKGCLGYYLYWTTSGTWSFLPIKACRNNVNVVPVCNLPPDELAKYFW